MHKKDSIRYKKNLEEEKVEDIYGVHFKYQDLFSRLLKVQKQRKQSEETVPLVRMPSLDSAKFRQLSMGKVKKVVPMNKKSTSITNFEQKNNKRSASVRKIVMRQPLTDRKHEIFKSHSPNQKKMTKPAVPVKQGKKIDKKASSTVRLSKKVLLKRR